jgi:hypothetical protein
MVLTAELEPLRRVSSRKNRCFSPRELTTEPVCSESAFACLVTTIF